jgi:hypothetical protein
VFWEAHLVFFSPSFLLVSSHRTRSLEPGKIVILLQGRFAGHKVAAVGVGHFC